MAARGHPRDWVAQACARYGEETVLGLCAALLGGRDPDDVEIDLDLLGGPVAPGWSGSPTSAGCRARGRRARCGTCGARAARPAWPPERLPVSRQAIARHLGVLAAAGLVEPERAGKQLRYRAIGARLSLLAQQLDAIGRGWDARLERLKAIAEAEAGTAR